MKKIILLGLFIVAPLTANAAVVDLNAKTNTNLNPIELNLKAGTYNVEPFAGNFTSWNAWNGQTSGCNADGGNCSKGYVNGYAIETPETGIMYFKDGGKYGGRYSTPGLALLNTLSATFTLLSDATVKFFINDSYYKDNTGGMSLNISAVPIPAAAFLFAPALLGFIGLRRKIKNTVA